MLCKR